jgi:hypothetical protein
MTAVDPTIPSALSMCATSLRVAAVYDPEMPDCCTRTIRAPECSNVCGVLAIRVERWAADPYCPVGPPGMVGRRRW